MKKRIKDQEEFENDDDDSLLIDPSTYGDIESEIIMNSKGLSTYRMKDSDKIDDDLEEGIVDNILDKIEYGKETRMAGGSNLLLMEKLMEEEIESNIISTIEFEASMKAREDQIYVDLDAGEHDHDDDDNDDNDDDDDELENSAINDMIRKIKSRI